MRLLSIAIAFVMAVLAPRIASAEQHPAYLHALSDLRAARAMLKAPAKADVKWDENKAIAEIDAAIREIKEASIDDGKNIDEHPAIDAKLGHRDRLRNAMNLLKASAEDIEKREDDKFSRGLRNRANNHIRAAEKFVREAIEDRATPPPEQHPAYLHALSDLRMARALLKAPAKADVKWDENKAIREIDAAISEIKSASIDDGKNIDDHPALDASLNHRSRLKNAMDMLAASARDVEQKEDNSYAKGLRDRANGHIRAAEKFVREAIEDQRTPPPAEHPAYLHALSDLRAARAMLRAPAKADVKWDENKAIAEIDAAIREIKEASIDDGKNLDEHPTIDAKLNHRDRLRNAMNLLKASAEDIEKREDDKFSRGLRNRANNHIRAAEKFVREAVEDRRN